MFRALGLVCALTFTSATMLPAQGGGRMSPPPDHWITADSLAKAVGGDATVAKQVGPLLAEVDKILKQAAADRAKMMPASGPRPDEATMEGLRTQMQLHQDHIDQRLNEIRAGLTPKQQVAFDALKKPRVARIGPGGMVNEQGKKS